jgi:Heme NO binding associated.
MFERAEQRSSELERSYELLDCWKRRGDELLYSMIPRSVADTLRTEKNSVSTCQVRVQRILDGCHLLRVFYDFSGFRDATISNTNF